MVCSGLVVHVADQGVARVGGDGQYAALMKKCNGLLEQTRLWIVGVNRKVLCHDLTHQDSAGMTAIRLSRTVNKAPNAPHRATMPMPTRVQ